MPAPKPFVRPRFQSALIVDPDHVFLDKLRKAPEFATTSPLLIEKGDEAQKIIHDPSLRFGGIFLSSTIAWPCAIPLVREIHRHHPATPIYLLYRDFVPFADKEIVRMAVHELIKKPVELGELLKRVLPTGTLPKLPEQLPKSEGPAPEADQSEFVPVMLEEFLSERPSFFDIYVRVPTGKFLKILNAKETLGHDRIVKYMQNGASHLYIRKNTQMRCLSYCDFLAANILQATDVSTEMKFLQTSSLGQDFLTQFKESDAESFNVDYGFSFLGGLFNLVRQNKADGDKELLVKEYLKNATAVEHAVGVSFLCAMLSLPLKIEAPKVFKQLGLASLFHDIGLAKMPPKYADEEIASLNEPERKEFEQHPLIGAEIIGRMESVEALAVQAVAQHHERRDNTGYPNKIGPGQIQVVAEMIGIADEFSHLLRRKRANPSINIQGELEKRVFNGFSNQVVEAFRSVFFKNGVLQAIQH